MRMREAVERHTVRVHTADLDESAVPAHERERPVPPPGHGPEPVGEARRADRQQPTVPEEAAVVLSALHCDARPRA
ncbi:hypothetical protein [Nocardiopsis chromatogenes]|uniref:hypothetical protein n=1 Tax=Nocardiopsis chromatogenes TaxID=280239 RepID=UPI00034A58C6|nr:hypothetical protein [Nocardiopsis chromatogenes]